MIVAEKPAQAFDRGLRTGHIGCGCSGHHVRSPGRYEKRDAAAASLGPEATPASFAAVHKAIEDAETALVRARATQVMQRFQAETDRAMAETSLDRVQQLLDQVMAHAGR
jgi:hypothetical protein